MKSPLLTLTIAFLSVFAGGRDAHSHEIRPGLLKVTEREPGWYDVLWKVPAIGSEVLGLAPVFPDHMRAVGPPVTKLFPGARVQRFTYQSSSGLKAGDRVSIDGLSRVQVDVLLQVQLLGGTSFSYIFKPATPVFELPLDESRIGVAKLYWEMGLIHIFEGFDHLLFLFAMLLLVTGFWKLVKTITAFTVAHTLTLGVATLGFVHVPAAPTEAIISLSIVFLATEIVMKHKGETPLTVRHPWGVAFFFGLFHGLGFAGALSQIGLPSAEVPLALLAFNIGVETGQVIFILVLAAVLVAGRRVGLPKFVGSWRMAPYAIGSVAAYWTIERVVSMI